VRKYFRNISCLLAKIVYDVTHMEKTLLDLVEFLKSGGLDHAVFNWSAQDCSVEWFDGAAYMKGACVKIGEDYTDAVFDLLCKHYPDFDFNIGTYGEVYVYPFGEVEIVLTKRILSEEYHRKNVDLLSTHSSVG